MCTWKAKERDCIMHNFEKNWLWTYQPPFLTGSVLKGWEGVGPFFLESNVTEV